MDRSLLRVAVIDDDESVRRVLRRLLRAGAAVADEADHYERAKRHIAEAEPRISRQRAIIENLIAAGSDVSTAQALLSTMERSLETMRIYLQRIEPKLARKSRQVVIPDIDMWRAALLMLKRHNKNARVRAIVSACDRLWEGDFTGSATWRRIFDMITMLLAKAPAEGEKVH
jgi:hypothetical protein